MSDVLHVGQAILDWMRDQPVRPVALEWATSSVGGSLFGLPVRFDESLPSGAWKLMRDGKQIGEGYVGREGEITAYLSGRGFISFAEPELPAPAVVRMSVQPPYERVRWLTPPPMDPNPILRVTGV